jgi:hypothetical protein
MLLSPHSLPREREREGEERRGERKEREGERTI